MDTRYLSSEMVNKLYRPDVNNEGDGLNNISNSSRSKNSKENEQKLATIQDNGHGDGKINSEIHTMSLIHQDPRHLAAGECQIRVNPNSTWQCNQEPQTAFLKTLPQTNVPLQFTPRMIADQEMLVSTMTQQGIPESLIHRHFDRLLEEQSKQLQSLGDVKLTDQKKSKKEDVLKIKKQIIPEKLNYNVQEKAYDHNYNSIQAIDNHNYSCNCQIATNVTQGNQEQSNVTKNKEECSACTDRPESNDQRKVEPSSLLKIRLQKEAINAQTRNNGLQEDAVALEIIQNCKYKNDSKHASLNNEDSLAYLKLNGTQDKMEMEKFQAIYAPNTLRKHEKRTICNGLENTRSPHNPQFAPKSARCRAQQLMDERLGVVYPPQRPYYNYYAPVTNSGNDFYEHKHSRNCQCNQDDGLPTKVENKAHSQYSKNVPVQEHNPARYNNQCNLTFWPEFQEPRIIGGLTYFATKPDFLQKINVPHHNYVGTDQSESTN